MPPRALKLNICRSHQTLMVTHSASEITYIVSRGALNSTHSLTTHLIGVSGADFIGHERGHRQQKEEQTRDWPNCTDHHEIDHQNDQLYFYSKKMEGHDQKIFPALRSGRVPTFKFLPAPLVGVIILALWRTSCCSLFIYMRCHNTPPRWRYTFCEQNMSYNAEN